MKPYLFHLIHLFNTFRRDNKEDTDPVEFKPFWFSFRDHLRSRIICGAFWGSFSVVYRTRSKCYFRKKQNKINQTKNERKERKKRFRDLQSDDDGDRSFLKYAFSKISWFLWTRPKQSNKFWTCCTLLRFFAAPARPRMSQSKWIMHWTYNAKIRLANAWSVDNKL